MSTYDLGGDGRIDRSRAQYQDGNPDDVNALRGEGLMQLRILGVLAVVALAGFACWLVIAMLKSLSDASRLLFKSIIGGLKNYSARRVERKTQVLLERQRQQDEISRQIEERTREAEQQQIDDFRQRHPVQIVGLPDLDLLKRIANQLDVFVAAANSYRPKFTPLYDDHFRATSFSYPFEFFFPRKNRSGDGPEPQAWQTTLDSLGIQGGRELRHIYDGLASASEFSAMEPLIIYDRPPSPQQPNIRVPTWSPKIIASQDGSEIDVNADVLARVYAPEILQLDTVRRAAEIWKKQIALKLESANEAHDMMELFIANENLKFRECKQSVLAEYQSCKNRFEQQAVQALRTRRETIESE